MSAREWQPGDVAHYDGLRLFRTQGEDWIDSDGDPRAPYSEHALRPLAVIDPEAPIPDEWAAAFRDGALDHGTVTRGDSLKAGLAALFAHIAAPAEPKPDEPTGDRATVRDRDGRLWTRLADYGDDPEPWRGEAGWGSWDDLDVPADGVLFGGVE